MPYDLTYEPENDLVLCRTYGKVEFALLQQLAQDAVQLVSAHNAKRVLNDLRDAELKLTTIQIYSIPELLSEAGLPMATRRALVISEDVRDYSFFETVSVNRCQSVKVFTDLEEARCWLLE